ncbi:MAG: type II toxin-antitoxin system RelE/ParE family toxin [Verrucomicrobia bacterium]|nr:type II toxin-antitoxin system RelE/ParE family toxin [Verrucomicrobiota bacterium]
MKRAIIEIRAFSREVDNLMRKKKLLLEDFEALKKRLAQNPEDGDLIPGTGGVRKIRLKSVSRGKSGGFRVCYFDDPERRELFLMQIYAKNEQENLSPGEKKTLKEFAERVKRR